MGESLWKAFDSSKEIAREQLELVIQKKKIAEVLAWFKEHFVSCSRPEYISKSPIVIIQGPAGSGKTSALRWISHELEIPIKEYSETTDITAINNDLAKALTDEGSSNSSLKIDRRKALQFEHFVINSIRYNNLYPAQEEPSLLNGVASENLPTEDAEFDSDEEFPSKKDSRPPPPKVSGVIIHIETPLTFARSQRILIGSLIKLTKIIKQISKYSQRRVAIVFETLEGERETISLPTNIKQSLGIQVFKFNSVTKANMKKLVESLIKDLEHTIIDRETVEQLANDCNGDTRACINTLQLICNRSKSTANGFNGTNIINGKFNNNSIHNQLPANKKLKLDHEKKKHMVKLSASLMRDSSRSLGFFHVLGKIFYQKRLYPYPGSTSSRFYRRNERPYSTENSTEYIADLLDVEPKNLNAWLHQHYYKFCSDYNIEKAALFLENHSMVDITSINSTQSSQFYEMHNTLDQLQIYLAIGATVFSLYEDQSNITKPSHKKVFTDSRYYMIKSSVEALHSSNGELYSFNKPVTLNLPKLVDAHQILLDSCTTKLMATSSSRIDSTKALVDYIPYLVHMSDNLASLSPDTRSRHYNGKNHSILDDDKNIVKVFKTLENLVAKPESDFESRHEKLQAMIEEIKKNTML